MDYSAYRAWSHCFHSINLLYYHSESFANIRSWYPRLSHNHDDAFWLAYQKDLPQVISSWIKEWVRRRRHEWYYENVYYKHLLADHYINQVMVMPDSPLTLEQIFVNPHLIDISPHSDETSPNNLPVDSPKHRWEQGNIWYFLKEKTPILILNAPGMGKSTLLRNMVLTLAHKQQPKELKQLYLPFLLNLRDTNFIEGFRDNKGFSLENAVERMLEKRLEKPPPVWVKKKLANAKNCVILLDSLDEIANPKILDDVTNWINEQINRYPNNRFVITSRLDKNLANLKEMRTLEI
jgi:NACHT domain